MAEEDRKGHNSVVQEIGKKFRLSISVVAFVIITLFAVIVRYVLAPAPAIQDLLPDVSLKVIIGICLFLSLVGLYYSVSISKQVLRIVKDYGNRIEKILGITSDLREEMYGDILLEKIMEYALAITNSQAGSILLADSEVLVFKIVKGEKAEQLVGTTVEKGKGISGWVAQTGKAVRISDVSRDERFNPAIDSMTGFDTKSVLCVPLKTKSGVIGVLELLNKEGGYAYRERDEEVITYLAEQAAISIIKTKFVEDQKNYEIHLTEMLLEAIDFHIPEKRGHSKRVARYSNIIARGINMPEDEKKRLYFASLLHDVGFLKIHSDEAFRKEEFTRHPSVGYEMIKPINFYEDIALFILHHHERYDGYGYPSKLQGEGIPLEARIIAIAEAFDAMVSTTSYRVPVSFQEAVEELKRKAGTQFDQELVEIFVSNIEPQHVTA
ncbi:MAG: HD domain-containing protein [Nitrospiraceae bacterium]|nr:HD domain-containing protein [Nitrospiraceae bacterium]